MVAPIPLLLAGGKLGLKLLPAIGAVAGAAPGLRRGNIGEALLVVDLVLQLEVLVQVEL